MDRTYTDLLRSFAEEPSPDQATLLVAVLTLARPHELLDHRTYVRNGNLSLCGQRKIPLGVAAAHVLGGDGPTSERLPYRGSDSPAKWIDAGTADQIAAAATEAALHAAQTSEERRAVFAYCGRTNISADLKLAARLIDNLTRKAGFELPTPTGRRLRVVG
jgi:hypothetical protein